MVQTEVDPASLKNAAATLHDLAHDLQAGQFDLFLLQWAGDPASHPDVAKALRTFAEFAHDQYQDMVALLAALSSRVKDAGEQYQAQDQTVAQDMTSLLGGSTFQPSDQRTK